jgi:A/G-specific adenine glycosylase
MTKLDVRSRIRYHSGDSLFVIPMVSPAHPPEAFASALERWFAEHRKDYPWRQTTDPYAILVAEVMLQQTQITTVLDRGYYARWLEQFPTFEALAAAEEDEVLRAWEGLGYYRRARNLHKLAKHIVDLHGGVMPREPSEILALPGIGPYTTGAVASFAFGLKEPIVDGNVARVLMRVFDDRTPIDTTEGTKRLWERAKTLVRASTKPGDFNSGLMELGQTICRVSDADCIRCPVKAFCRATTPTELPIKSKRTVITEVTERVFFHRSAGSILLEQETGNRRTGLWKLPALPESDALPTVLHKATYGITRYKVTLWVHDAPRKHAMPDSHRWIPLGELGDLPMPAPYRKALHAVMRAADFQLEA